MTVVLIVMTEGDIKSSKYSEKFAGVTDCLTCCYSLLDNYRNYQKLPSST